MLFADWEVRMVKNCHRPRAAFSSPRSQFFTIRTDPKPANKSMFIFFFLQSIGFAADIQMGLFTQHYVIESGGAPSTNDL